MLTLKKLFYPEVQDKCPNCGEACAITDVLCATCGKNLDELFEQLSDSEVVHDPKTNPQVTRLWNVTNSAVLIASLLTPWIVSFSDVIAGKIEFQYFIGLEVILFPIQAVIYRHGYLPGQFLPAIGASLLVAIAPAMAVYYSVLGIRTLFDMRAEVNTPTSRFWAAIFRLLAAVMSLGFIGYSVGSNSNVSLGYILVIIGLSSAYFLELIAPILR